MPGDRSACGVRKRTWKRLSSRTHAKMRESRRSATRQGSPQAETDAHGSAMRVMLRLRIAQDLGRSPSGMSAAVKTVRAGFRSHRVGPRGAALSLGIVPQARAPVVDPLGRVSAPVVKAPWVRLQQPDRLRRRTEQLSLGMNTVAQRLAGDAPSNSHVALWTVDLHVLVNAPTCRAVVNDDWLPR